LYPEGIVSIVSDTWDFWKVITETLPALKDKIMSRNGKLVIRPDSGDPVKILCGDPDGSLLAEKKGLIECLYDLFGGTINSKGYKQLDSHIGAIYGESITIERCQQITTQLKDKGFASSNVIFGVGSYTMQHNTRDSLGFAMKTTYAEIDGKPTPVFKDPKTDTNKLKKSLKGYIKVLKKGNEYKTVELEKKEQVENCFITLMNEDSIFPETDFYHIQTTWENDFKCLLNK
jgi:nicotinamide phosphoribosyltransferase